AVAEVDADDPHALDERLAQRLLRRPPALEQDLRTADDLVCEAVVEVVVHLLHELVVRQRLEHDLFVGHATPRFLWSYPSCAESERPSVTRSRPRRASSPRGSLTVGPETLSAATTAPEASRTADATAQRPGSSSSTAIAYPFARTSSSASSSAVGTVCGARGSGEPAG